MNGLRSEPDEGLNRLTEMVIGAAMEVHRELGPGLLETFYEQALCVELAAQGIAFSRQVGVRVFYKGTPIGESRMDIVVAESLLLELKASDGHSPLHMAQVLSYLKTSRLPLGLLINFNVPVLRRGIRRVVRTPLTLKPSAPSAPSAANLSLSKERR